MVATVDVQDQGGKTLADTPRLGAATQTAVFDPVGREADLAVRRIVGAQLGKPVAERPLAKPAQLSLQRAPAAPQAR